MLDGEGVAGEGAADTWQAAPINMAVTPVIIELAEILFRFLFILLLLYYFLNGRAGNFLARLERIMKIQNVCIGISKLLLSAKT
ncbi:hypothetical protein [Microbulbifer aggregans]|uniref:hypothetical protein n=1 Tax=Microbulbifer aggregans TaxID=1769779 RepID=UPI001CFC7D92|nr:hypothetical protein [Microbulbifer aggregans]